MEQEIGGNIDKALAYAGCNDDISRVVGLTELDLETLIYEEGVGTNVKLVNLKQGPINLLRCLRAFYVCKKNKGIDIDSTWCDIPGEHFDDFCMDE